MLVLVLTLSHRTLAPLISRQRPRHPSHQLESFVHLAVILENTPVLDAVNTRAT